MTPDPTILTIVLNYRTPDLTIRSAEAALREMASLNGQVTIVDNASDDGSFDQIKKAAQARGWLQSGRVQVLPAPNPPFRGACKT